MANDVPAGSFSQKVERYFSLLILFIKGQSMISNVVVVALLFYVHGKHLRSCRDGQLT